MIGPYRLERVLGTGSFATVWLALDGVLERQVAVKILADNWSRDHDVRRRFLAEARVLLTAESPRIIRGFHIDETPDGQPYLVMAYADRGTIGDRIEQRRREGRTFNATETVGIVTEVATALVDVHASGHLHRDVKPSNVLVRTSSMGRPIPGLAADEAVVLGDFGLARGLDLSAVTMVAGSPGYVAPEQAAGLTQLDRRADLYPLGRMMIEMLAGDPGGRATTMAGAAAEEVDVVASLTPVDGEAGAPSRELVELISRLVAKNPEERPESADEVVAALVGIADTSERADDRSAQGPPLLPPNAPRMAAPATGGGGPPTAGAADAVDAKPEPAGGPPRRRVAVIAGALLVVLAITALVVALVRGAGDGGGNGTTTAPASPAPVLAADTSAAASPTVSSTPEESSSSLAASDEVLVLPEGAFSGDAIGTATPNPDRQQGVMLMSADEFAAALVAANPEWTGEPPAPDADGTVDFTMEGFGRTADVHVEPTGETTGAVIVAFTIDYV
jgi:Protein kinase domain